MALVVASAESGLLWVASTELCLEVWKKRVREGAVAKLLTSLPKVKEVEIDQIRVITARAGCEELLQAPINKPSQSTGCCFVRCCDLQKAGNNRPARLCEKI